MDSNDHLGAHPRVERAPRQEVPHALALAERAVLFVNNKLSRKRRRSRESSVTHTCAHLNQ